MLEISSPSLRSSPAGLLPTCAVLSAGWSGDDVAKSDPIMASVSCQELFVVAILPLVYCLTTEMT